MKSTFLFLSLILTLAGYGQNNQTWTLYRTVNGVEVYTQNVDCYAENIPAQKAIIVKLVNLNNYDCTIEWDLTVWYNYEKQTGNVKDGENHHSTELKANQSIEGSCDTPYGAFYIFKDFITYVSPTKLTKFELENINVTRI